MVVCLKVCLEMRSGEARNITFGCPATSADSQTKRVPSAPSVQNFVEDKREAGPKAEVPAIGLEVNRVSAIRAPRRKAHRDVC